MSHRLQPVGFPHLQAILNTCPSAKSRPGLGQGNNVDNISQFRLRQFDYSLVMGK
jgi:hypothetical protein